MRGMPLPGRKEQSHRYYALNKEKIKKAQAQYRDAHAELNRQRVREWRQRIKLACMTAYGGKCACCGEDRIEFLSIDHMNGGGKKHRKEVGYGQRFYSWLAKNQFPEGFRVLCFNCNLSLGFHGYCPHGNPAIKAPQKVTSNNEEQYAGEKVIHRNTTF